MENKKEWYGCEKHEHFASYADKYIDGELTEKQISELFEHVEECAECRRCLEITVKTDEAVDVPEMASLPRGLHAHIMSSVKTEAAAARVREQKIPRVSRFVPIAAAFLCIFLVAAFFMSTPTRFNESSDKLAEDALPNGSAIVKPEADEEIPAPEPPENVPSVTDTPTDDAPVTTAPTLEAPVTTAPSADTTANAQNAPSGLLDSDSITFIIFGLCALFALSSVAALAAFVFAAKKKQ
mgnify:CR=1 FL=1